MIEELSNLDATVLIEGETGTGKELVANAIHNGNRVFTRFAEQRAVDAALSVDSHDVVLQRRVVDAVMDLREPYKSAVVFRYLDELRPEEIAERLGVPVGTVKSRLKRGLAMLRERFDPTHLQIRDGGLEDLGARIADDLRELSAWRFEVGGDETAAAGGGFDEDEREAFVERGQDHDGGGAHDRGEAAPEVGTDEKGVDDVDPLGPHELHHPTDQVDVKAPALR